jgi:hypothetical protein
MDPQTYRKALEAAVKSIPQQARHNYLMVSGPDGDVHDVTGIQSDQAEKWDSRFTSLPKEKPER